MLRYFWRGVGQFWGGGETAFHNFLGKFIERFGYSRGAALEVLWGSTMLKNCPNFKAKVGVRLNLEVLWYKETG